MRCFTDTKKTTKRLSRTQTQSGHDLGQTNKHAEHELALRLSATRVGARAHTYTHTLIHTYSPKTLVIAR